MATVAEARAAARAARVARQLRQDAEADAKAKASLHRQWQIQAKREAAAVAAASLPGKAAFSDWSSAVTDQEWKMKLTAEEYLVLRKGGTDKSMEHPFINFFPSDGYFGCAGCGLALYSCQAKVEHNDFPTFRKCFHSDELGPHVRSDDLCEIHCSRCKSHLGHAFGSGVCESH